jgi:hypothetical protein
MSTIGDGWQEGKLLAAAGASGCPMVVGDRQPGQVAARAAGDVGSEPRPVRQRIGD